jgi:hypothetical protein
MLKHKGSERFSILVIGDLEQIEFSKSFLGGDELASETSA